MEEKIENDEKYYRYIQDGIKKMLQNIGNYVDKLLFFPIHPYALFYDTLFFYDRNIYSDIEAQVHRHILSIKSLPAHQLTKMTSPIPQDILGKNVSHRLLKISD